MDHSRSIEIVKLFPYYFFFGFYIVLSALQVSSLCVNKYDAKMQKKDKKEFSAVPDNSGSGSATDTLL